MRISDWSSDVCSSDLFTGGFRWSRDYSKRRNVDIRATPTGAVVIGPSANQTPTYRESAPSYTVAIDYQVNPDLLLYITHRRGFKPGGVNATSALSNVPGIKATFDPEPLKDVEGGIKADWRSEEHTSELQSLMRISSAVFCLKKKN